MIKKEIILCEHCNGKGILYEEKCTCYHRGEYDYIPYECPSCKGSGRQLKTTKNEITFEPYKTPEE